MPEIVRGDASHVDALEPLWHAMRAHHGSVTDLPLRDPADSWARRRKNYVDILAEGGALFLAMEGDRIVGHAICEVEQGGSPTWTWPEDFLAIVDIVLLPEARGQGAGDALMAAIEEEGRRRGVAALDLMVVAENASARRFYERHGFTSALVTYRRRLR